MTSIFKATHGEMNEFVGRLSRAGLSTEMLRLVNEDPSLAERMVNASASAIGRSDTSRNVNPFALSVNDILARFRQASEAQDWNIGEDVFERLAATAPELPEGRLAFLSLKIRFGNGQKGVQDTFEAHVSEIRRVHVARKVWRWNLLRSDKSHLCLLAGDETHTPTIEWCIIDLDTHRKRQSVKAVRGPDFIADKGLVLAWLYPEYVRAIDYMENPGYFLAGYKLNAVDYVEMLEFLCELPVPEGGEGLWNFVPRVFRHLDTDHLGLGADWHGNADSDYSVPVYRE